MQSSAPSALGGLIPFLCILPMILLSVAACVFWVWAIVDCVKNEPSEGNDKIMCVLLIVFLHGLGALIYFFVRRPQRISLYGR